MVAPTWLRVVHAVAVLPIAFGAGPTGSAD